MARNPESAEGYYRLGQAHLQLREFAKAKVMHERALQINPGYDPAHHALAVACEGLGQREEAEAHRREFAKRKHVPLAASLAERGGVDDVDLGRENLAEAHLVAARTYLAVANAPLEARPSLTVKAEEEADRHLRAAAAADPKNREARMTLVGRYDAAKRYREAADVLRELQALEPGDATHLINRGILLVRMRDYEEAEHEFRRAMEVAPQEADGYAKLASMYLRQGSWLNEARDLARTACQLRPDGENHALLAEVCAALDDLPAAEAAIARAIALEPEHPRAKQVKARIDAKRSP